MKNLCIALRVCAAAVVCLCASTSQAATISVAAGGDLQSALLNAQPGDTITLARGAVYTGNFVLPVKGGAAMIVVRTEGDADLPGAGQRISPADSPRLATIKTPNNTPAIQTAWGAHHWTLMLLEIAGTGGNDVMTLGDGNQTQLSQVAHDLVVDRVYLHGNGVNGQKRGIALNSAATTVTGSYISEIKQIQQDSQAVGGYNGPGPFTITNNYLEAAAENIMFGGADPGIPGLVPSDIVISDNFITKPTAWRTQDWSTKNLLELKNARRVTITRNTFEYNWQGGQSGWAIVLTVRNQDGGCPWCQVDHVTFEQNVVRHVAGGFQILGYDYNYPSQQTHAIVIRNNLFVDVDTQKWGGSGYLALIVGQPREITFDHNTFISDHGLGVLQFGGDPILQFTFTNNIAKANDYGIIGDSHAPGNDSISAFIPASTISMNVFAGANPALYPAGNAFPTTQQFEAQFSSYAAGDYRLLSSSPWRGAATDGLDLGAILGAGAAISAAPAAPAAPAAGEPTADPIGNGLRPDIPNGRSN
jgi:Right handed beta helix region